MGVSSTTFQFDGDSSKALAELRKIQDANKALEQAVQKMVTTSEKGSQATTKALALQTKAVRDLSGENEKLKKKVEELKNKQLEAGDVAMKAYRGLTSILGVSGVLGAITKVIAAQHEYNKALAQTALEQDKVGRKVQVQALMGDAEFQRTLKNSIAPIATKYAKSLPETQAVVTELLNQGVDKKGATGAILDEVLAAATGTGADDPATVARGIVGFLRSSGKDITPENVRGLSAPLAGLFKDRPIQSGDIDQLASIGALMKEFGINQSEAFGAFTVMRNEGRADASTATVMLRNIATILASAKSDKSKMNVLEQIGGKGFAEEIDLVGESLPQALANLSSAVGAQPENKRAAIMENLFGREVLATATSLLSPQGVAALRANQEAQLGGEAALQKGVEIYTSGPAAAVQRLKNRQEMAELARAEKTMDETLAAKALDVMGAESNAPGWYLGLTGGIRERLGTVGLKNVPQLAEMTRRAREGAKLGKQGFAPIAPTEVEQRKFQGAPGPIEFFEGGGGEDKNLDPRALELSAREIEWEKAKLAASQYRLEANRDNDITEKEAAKLHALEQAAAALRVTVEAMQIEHSERALAAKRDKAAALPPINREGNQ